jgi:arabinogalactan endo-1,4-beta-galactosidase
LAGWSYIFPAALLIVVMSFYLMIQTLILSFRTGVSNNMAWAGAYNYTRLVYWEPAWLTVKGSCWALKEGCEYIGETGCGGNEWANQALFDYQGNSLPAFKAIRDFSLNTGNQ